VESRRDEANINRGILMPIGGAEDRKGVILRRFVDLCGGSNACIAVIPTPSNLPDTGAVYARIFREMGAPDVRVVNPSLRREANDPDCIGALDEATGIFISGGDQVKLMSIIGGTGLSRAIRARYQAGAVIAGTSAGASAMSEHMIAFGRSGAKPSQRMVQMGTGLGLAPHLVIDQHFTRRNRLGRLMTAVLYCPDRIGVGMDENTAIIVRGDNTAEVIGTGSVTILDGSELEYTDVHTAKRHSLINVVGFRALTLYPGSEFDFNALQVIGSDQIAAD
jgi:cyanophycinase